MLDSARESQKLLSESELAARQAECEAEGARLLAQTNVIEREVANRVAANRMKRLLSE